MDKPADFERVAPGEEAFIRDYLDDLAAYQVAVETKHHGTCPVRGFHTKTLAAAWGTYRSDANLPEELRVGLGAVSDTRPAIVRFSSGQSFEQPDYVPDIRGFAVKILDIDGEPLPDAPTGVQDLLSVNANNHSIRNGETFARLALTASSPIKALTTPWKIMPLRDQFRLAWEAARLTRRTFLPLSSCSYFGTGPISFGSLPAKFRWVPANPPERRRTLLGRDGLRQGFCRDLTARALDLDLYVQLFVDEQVTPVEDLGVKWDERLSPPQKVGRLRLARIHSPASLEKACEDVEDLAFSPWHSLAVHRPLGNLQRLRRETYRQSADRRGARPRP